MAEELKEELKEDKLVVPADTKTASKKVKEDKSEQAPVPAEESSEN